MQSVEKPEPAPAPANITVSDVLTTTQPQFHWLRLWAKVVLAGIQCAHMHRGTGSTGRPPMEPENPYPDLEYWWVPCTHDMRARRMVSVG
eukprot:SAG11_NODE_33248_length_278_cov_0.865922_1_plen_89_part_10